MTPDQLTGQTRSHIKQYQNPRFAVQPEVKHAFCEMRFEAEKEGFLIHPFSAFRDFNTQLKIWNMKFSGKRILLSRDASPLNPTELSNKTLVETILFWSALPGSSRHHWGTDIDVIDGAVQGGNYRAQLLPEEVEEGGVFYNLHCWLDQHIERFGFFRPYKEQRGGVSVELWHLSYAPISRPAIQNLSLELIHERILNSDIYGKQSILESLPGIYEKFILNICD
ncbi:MAG: M15 family metallopeptidase [Proteobacteria bacterium]|nr:M15 family metallopeptidase [Pseudomonadota bacterium]